MKLDSGRGDVMSSFFETKLNKSKYPFTVIKNSNDKDYWIVSPVNKDTFYIYPLTSSGIGKPKKQPKISFVFGSFAAMKGNHKGDRICLINLKFGNNAFGGIQYYFDNTNGLLSKPQLFYDRTPTLNNNKDSILIIGPEYSANDSFLYFSASEINSNLSTWEMRIYQSETYGSINNTIFQIHKDIGYYAQDFGFQLGPDNKIYCAYPTDSFLNIIQYPDKKGFSCNYNRKVIDIRPGNCGLSMPNIYAPVRHLKFNGIDKATASCADSIHFTNLSDTVYFKSFKWYFGDGDSSTKYAPWHAYKKQGK
jgi:hypothetical protein